jgi:hypothetical protein
MYAKRTRRTMYWNRERMVVSTSVNGEMLAEHVAAARVPLLSATVVDVVEAQPRAVVTWVIVAVAVAVALAVAVAMVVAVAAAMAVSMAMAMAVAVAVAMSVAVAVAVAMAVAVAVAVARAEAAAARRLALRRVGDACCAPVRRTAHRANWKAPRGVRRLHLELSASRGGIRYQTAVAAAVAKVAKVETT